MFLGRLPPYPACRSVKKKLNVCQNIERQGTGQKHHISCSDYFFFFFFFFFFFHQHENSASRILNGYDLRTVKVDKQYYIRPKETLYFINIVEVYRRGESSTSVENG